MAIQAILSNFTAFGAPAGAGAARLGPGLAASFAELLADELQQTAPAFPPQVAPQPTSAPQTYPLIAVPVVLAAGRDEKLAKKRPPQRGERRPSRR